MKSYRLAFASTFRGSQDLEYRLCFQYRRHLESPDHNEQATAQRSRLHRHRRAEWRGQTTFAREFLFKDAGVIHFVNADLIAGGFLPYGLNWRP
jgi:hypothetical protein